MNFQTQIKNWGLKQWVSAYNDWNHIHFHTKNCHCKNKEAVKCHRCTTVLCDKLLKDTYDKKQRYCYSCDTKYQPNPFNPRNFDLLELCPKCDNCNELLIGEKNLDGVFIDIHKFVHMCPECDDCHSYLNGYYCEDCTECHDGSHDEDTYLICPTCEECNPMDGRSSPYTCVVCRTEIHVD